MTEFVRPARCDSVKCLFSISKYMQPVQFLPYRKLEYFDRADSVKDRIAERRRRAPA